MRRWYVCERCTEDSSLVLQLLKDVQKVNQHINEAKRKDENTNKLVEIQNAIKTKGDKVRLI
jgi:hypothetical protein